MIVDGAGSRPEEIPVFLDAAGESLFGIVTIPAPRRSDTLSIVLPAGATVSIDRNRVGVRLCRRLADLGVPSIRFDYHGVGESDGYAQRFRLDEPFDPDLLGVVAWARSEGIERFVLIGSCFGARTAMASADRISGIEAIVLLAAPVRDYEMGDRVATSLAAGSDLSLHAHRALGRGAGALRDPAKRRVYARYVRTALLGLTRRAAHPDRRRHPDVSPHFLAALAELGRRSIPTLFVYGTEDALWHEFLDARSGPLASTLADAPSIEIATLEGSVHGFKTIEIQDAAIDLIADWLGGIPTDVTPSFG